MNRIVYFDKKSSSMCFYIFKFDQQNKTSPRYSFLEQKIKSQQNETCLYKKVTAQKFSTTKNNL